MKKIEEVVSIWKSDKQRGQMKHRNGHESGNVNKDRVFKNYKYEWIKVNYRSRRDNINKGACYNQSGKFYQQNATNNESIMSSYSNPTQVK